MSDLNEFLKAVTVAKASDPKHRILNEAKKRVESDIVDLFGKLKQSTPVEVQQIDALVESVELIHTLEDGRQVVGEFIVDTNGNYTSAGDLNEDVVPAVKPAAEQVPMKEIDKYLKRNASFQQPDPDKADPDIKALQDKLKFLEQAIGRIAATGPGSGEVNFRYLDDVNRSTMSSECDNWVLEYDVESGKVQFTDVIGPIQQVHFNTSHSHDEDRLVGTLCWDQNDFTLNLTHPNGVTQQVGQEQYYPPVINLTGSDIPNGTAVMFAGAEDDNNSRLLVGPMIADGTYPSVYTMGVTTSDIPDGGVGFVTYFGYVNDIDTSMWSKGDVLYADPSVPGGMTNIKPTAPDNCVILASVVKSDPVNGRIMVRPTIEQKMLYARFSSIVDQSPTSPNTPYPVVFGTTDIARGFHVDGEDPPDYSKVYAEDSGYYKFDATLSLTSTNSSSKSFYVWIRRNGVDVPRSAKRQSISGNGTYALLQYTYSVSLDAGDYIQIMYASSDTMVSINAPDATAFCPAIPSAALICVQVAL